MVTETGAFDPDAADQDRVPDDPVADNPWDLEVFYDGACPLCRREIAWIRKRDNHHRLRLTDISTDAFRIDDYERSMEQLMGELHGRAPDGQWVTGVEAFRRMYSAIGFGWLIALTRIPGVSHFLQWIYRLFARNRLRLTGRCPAESDSCQVTSRPRDVTKRSSTDTDSR